MHLASTAATESRQAGRRPSQRIAAGVTVTVECPRMIYVTLRPSSVVEVPADDSRRPLGNGQFDGEGGSGQTDPGYFMPAACCLLPAKNDDTHIHLHLFAT